MPPPPASFDWEFATFGDPSLVHLFTEAERFADETARGQKPRWLTLSGRSGVGKTHLARKLKEFWMTRSGFRKVSGRVGTILSRLDCRFVSWRRFIERQRAGGFTEIVELCELPFVIVDDIGAEYDPNGFARARLDELLDARLGKWTVITTNLRLSEIGEQLDTRISSRMLRGGSIFAETTATDYNLRPRMVKNQECLP